MTAELGLNLAGVERVLELEAEIEQMHARIEELELAALHAQVDLAEELERVRRSFRAELVPTGVRGAPERPSSGLPTHARPSPACLCAGPQGLNPRPAAGVNPPSGHPSAASPFGRLAPQTGSQRGAQAVAHGHRLRRSHQTDPLPPTP